MTRYGLRVYAIYIALELLRKIMSNPVEQFFSHFGSGDIESALKLVHPDAVFEAQGPSDVPIYGRFEGIEGARKFLTIASGMFDTEDFQFRKWATADAFVFAYGYMQHRVRKTGQLFKSEWALVCQVEDELIRSYKMFEDTAALAEAYA